MVNTKDVQSAVSNLDNNQAQNFKSKNAETDCASDNSERKEIKLPVEIVQDENTGNNRHRKEKGKRLSLILYIPENINIDELLLNNPPEKPLQRDCLVYIMDLITSIPSRQHDFDIEKNKGFSPVSKVYLQNRIHNYRDYLDYLKKHGIIIEGTSYIPNERSKGIKFTPEYQKKVVPVSISKYTLIKSITNGSHNRDLEAEQRLHYLKKWFNPNLTIDIDSANEFLENDKEVSRQKLIAKRQSQKRKSKKLQIPIDDIVMMGYNAKSMVVQKLHNQEYLFTVDAKAGRLHTPFTQIKKGMRIFLRYDGERLCNIDIRNSQLLFSLILMDINIFLKNDIHQKLVSINEKVINSNRKFRIFKIKSKFQNPFTINQFTNLKSFNKSNSTPSSMLVKMILAARNKPDIQKFIQWVSDGIFYENFTNELSTRNLIPSSEIDMNDVDESIRAFTKGATFSSIFSPLFHAMWNPYIKAFIKCFPNVYRIFALVKSGKGAHPTLACLFQSFEAEIVLHKACKEISYLYPDVPLFTIHDSIVTTRNNAALVNSILIKHVKEALGVEIVPRIEYW